MCIGKEERKKTQTFSRGKGIKRKRGDRERPELVEKIRGEWCEFLKLITFLFFIKLDQFLNIKHGNL